MKTLIALLFTGLLFNNCEPLKILEPNTESEVTMDSLYVAPDTSYTEPDTTGGPIDTTDVPIDTLEVLPDTTQVPVNREDLIMYMELRRMDLGEVMEYTGRIQTVSPDTVKIDNMDNLAISYTAFKNGAVFAGRPEESRIIFHLYENGYFQNSTEDTVVNVEVTNAWIKYLSGDGDDFEGNIPHPIILRKSMPRDNYYESERIHESGNYHFEINIDYAVLDTAYHVKFISETVEVGGLGKRVMPIKLEMRRE